jgi:hypothetical protein
MDPLAEAAAIALQTSLEATQSLADPGPEAIGSCHRPGEG